MKEVRSITILGLALGVLALMLITVDFRVALIVGLIGMALSMRNLITSK